jgi:hypothetical protein
VRAVALTQDPPGFASPRDAVPKGQEPRSVGGRLTHAQVDVALTHTPQAVKSGLG